MAGIGGLIAVCSTCTLDGPGIAIAEAATTVGSVLVLVAVTAAATTLVPRILNSTPLVWLGRRSYAMYLVQFRWCSPGGAFSAYVERPVSNGPKS